MCELPPVAAQQSPPPGCTAPEHRAFDFWVGDWAVTDSGGRVVYGRNHVSSEEQGCLLHERWTGSRGGSGQSLNFYDRGAGHWEQVWTGSDGVVLHLVGGVKGGRMVLEGDGVNAGGERVRNRVAWSPQADGRVRQFWEQSKDQGTTWQVLFDGWYRRAD